MAKLIAARGRLCAGRVWAGKSGACGASGGLRVPDRSRRGCGASLRPSCGLPVLPLLAAPGRLSLPAPRRCGATPRGLRGADMAGSGVCRGVVTVKSTASPLSSACIAGSWAESRPMARGAAIAATPTYRITTALGPSSSAPRRRASRRGYTTSRAGRGGCSSRRRRVRAVSRHRAPRRRIPWLGG